MRNKDNDIELVETPEEFIELFTESSWEFDYIDDRTQKLLFSWLKEYVKLKELINE